MTLVDVKARSFFMSDSPFKLGLHGSRVSVCVFVSGSLHRCWSKERPSGVLLFLCLSYPWEQGLSLIPELAYRPVSPRDPPISLSHRSVVVGM